MSGNAACPELLVLLKFFVSMASARRWQTREHDRKELVFYGRHRRKGTKPAYYYTRAGLHGLPHLKRDMVAHEVYRSWVAAFYWRWADRILTGADVDQTVLPDLTMLKGDAVYDVEVDTGEMSHKRMRDRFTKYGPRESTVLVVTTAGEERAENLRETAREVIGTACVTTFGKLVADPFGEVWKDADGDPCAIET